MYVLGIGISIHAPPRGATEKNFPGLEMIQFQFTPLREGRPLQTFPALLCWIFQFTPLREGRLTADIDPDNNSVFQFTPLREGRRGALLLRIGQTDFNSRPSARGDILR